MFVASQIQFMPLSMPKSYRSSSNRPIFDRMQPLSMPKNDLAPIQFMPLSLPMSYRSSCNRPIFNRMHPSSMPDHSSSLKVKLRLRCEAVKYDVVQIQPNENELNCVINFGSFSVESAAGIIEMANIIRTLDRTLHTLYGTICSFKIFEEMRIVIILSPMGKTISKLQLAGNKAVSCEVSNVPYLEELTFIKDLHLRAADELGIDRERVSKLLFELEQHLKLIASLKDMTPLAKDYMFSFGERMSSSLFAAYLNKIGVKSELYDFFEIGSITPDDLANVGIIEAAIPIFTSSLGKSMKLSKEGDKPVQVRISFNPKALETDMSKDIDINIVQDRNGTMLEP